MAPPSRRSIPVLDDICSQISATWRRTIPDWIGIGDKLSEAKDKLPHGQFLPWLERMYSEKKLPFGPRTAQEFMRIAKNGELRNPTNWSFLPCCYRTLAMLAKAPESDLKVWLKGGQITPETRIEDVRSLFGFDSKDEVIKALHTLLYKAYRFPPKELAEWAFLEPQVPFQRGPEDPAANLASSNDISALRKLAAYILDLHHELSQLGGDDAHGWNEGGVEAVHENARLAALEKEVAQKRKRANGKEHRSDA